MGAVPHRCAQVASDRSWPGLSPAVTSKAAAADPHAVQCQQVWGVWVTSLDSRALRCGFLLIQGRHPAPEDPQGGLGGDDDRSAPSRCPGRSAAARAASCWRAAPARGCRSSSGAVELRWRIWLRVLMLTDRPGAWPPPERPVGLHVRVPGCWPRRRRGRTSPPVPPRWHPADRTCRPSAGLAVAAWRLAISSARPLMTRCSLPQARHLTGRQGGPKDLFWQVDRPWRPSPQPPTLPEMGLAAWGQMGVLS